MKSLFTLLFVWLFLLPAALRAQDQTPEERYVKIYGLILQGDRTLENGRAAAAWTNYNDALTELKKLKVDYPDWNTKIVKYRMDDVMVKMVDSVKKGAPATNMSASDMDDSKLDLEPAGPVEFKLVWDIGKRYVHRVAMTQISEAGPSMQQETKMTQEIVFTPVKELENGGRELDMEILAISMEMKLGSSTWGFDSKKDAENDSKNPLAPLLRRMVGGKLKLLTDTNGNIETVQGIDEFMKRVLGPEGETNGMAEALKGLMTEESMKSMSPMLQGLPDHPVRVGDTWPSKSEVSMGGIGDLSANLTYTFKGWQMRENRKVAVFDCAGDIASKPAAEGTPAPMMNIEKGKASARTWFAPVLHTVIATKGNTALSMKVSLPTGQSVSTKTSQKIEANLVEGPPATK